MNGSPIDFNDPARQLRAANSANQQLGQENAQLRTTNQMLAEAVGELQGRVAQMEGTIAQLELEAKAANAGAPEAPPDKTKGKGNNRAMAD